MKEKQGGTRPGAGRKPKGQPTRTTTGEHLTWLDWYASGAAEKLGSAGTAIKGFTPEGDAEAVWLMAFLQIANMNLDRNRHHSDTEMATFSFWGALAGFIAPPRLQRFPEFRMMQKLFQGGTGLKLSSELVRAFAYAKAPTGADWQSLVTARGWYLDIPHQSLLIGDRQVRAILTHPDQIGGVAAVAILTEPNRNEIAGRYAWMLIGENAIPAGCADIDIDAQELQRRANDFVALSLLYYQSQDQCEPLPRRQTGSHLSKIQRKLERKTKSLFVIHKLPEPVANLGRPVDSVDPVDSVERGESGGWRLDHRVTVSGHYRWQPVGEGRTRRELRWIATHYRGLDLPVKPQLIPLTAVSGKSETR